MERRLDEFTAAGCGLVVVSQGTPAVLASFLKRYPKPYPVVGDPDRLAYKAFGLERTSLLNILRPDVLLMYLWRMLTGTRLRVPYPGEDVLQLGGDFIVDRSGKVVFAYRSRVATDRPGVSQLLAAVPRASGFRRSGCA